MFEVAVQEDPYTNSGETYQAKRIAFYSPKSYDSLLGERVGERVGQIVCVQRGGSAAAQGFRGQARGPASTSSSTKTGGSSASGELTYGGKAYLLSKTVFVLQSETNWYLFAAQNALNGNSSAASIPQP